MFLNNLYLLWGERSARVKNETDQIEGYCIIDRWQLLIYTRMMGIGQEPDKFKR